MIVSDKIIFKINKIALTNNKMRKFKNSLLINLINNNKIII
jgi:hypothetical protein